MSAVTVSEIADLVALKLAVPVSHMRGLGKGSAGDAEIARARTARNVVLVLARRHTQASLSSLIAFFDMSAGSGALDRISTVVRTADPGWLSADPHLHWQVEEIEQQIDALHERRMALRDRREVRA